MINASFLYCYSSGTVLSFAEKKIFCFYNIEKKIIYILSLISGAPDLDHVQGVIGAVQEAVLAVVIVGMIGKCCGTV